MKKAALGLTLLFVLFAFAQAQAAINWEGEYFQFRYSVQPNGGVFYNPASSYFNPNGQATQVFTNAGAVCGTFASIASGSLTEFGGAIKMNAMAKGPDGGVNPENGLFVEGYAEIVLDMFGDNYGADVDQLSKSWITRRFRVDDSGPYSVSANFTGDADFAAFGEASLRHHAVFSFKGTAVLEEYRQGTPPEKLRDVTSFNFDNTTGSDTVSVDLSNQPGLFYQLKVVLDLTTDVQNLYMMTSIQGPLAGPFHVGSADAPFQLSASVSSAPQYDLDVTVVGSGIVTLDPAGGTYSEGTQVNLTAEPNAGWDFSGWSGDLSGSGENAVITMNSDKSVTATFTEEAPPVTQYTLTMAVTGSGSTSPAVGAHIYDSGEVVAITATPADDWYFAGWTGDVANPSSASTTVTMGSNKTVTANFTEEEPPVTEYTLTMAVTGSGSTSPAVGAHIYDSGEVVAITATPADDWYFAGWTGEVANPSSASTTVTMDKNKTVTANFTEEAPPNNPPDTPVPVSPEEGAEDVSLTPVLETGDFSDPDGDGHAQTQWQISTNGEYPGFEDALVLDVTSDCNLTSLTVPPFILDVMTTYYWRVKFFDDQGSQSEWSGISWFTTTDVPLFADLNENGIPDDQEVGDDVDLNGNGVPDNSEPDTIKSVNTVVGDCQMGVERPEVGSNVASIDYVMSVDSAEVPNADGMPGEMPIGLICFQLAVSDSEEPAVVRVYMCRPGPEGSIWYHYGPADCWEDFSSNADFSEDGTWVELALMDGGEGDADGLANGVIVHCSGRGNERHRGSSDSDCFIGTAASQLLFGGGLIVLMIIAGSMLVLVIATYVMNRRSKIREMQQQM